MRIMLSSYNYQKLLVISAIIGLLIKCLLGQNITSVPTGGLQISANGVLSLNGTNVLIQNTDVVDKLQQLQMFEVKSCKGQTSASTSTAYAKLCDNGISFTLPATAIVTAYVKGHWQCSNTANGGCWGWIAFDSESMNGVVDAHEGLYTRTTSVIQYHDQRTVVLNAGTHALNFWWASQSADNTCSVFYGSLTMSYRVVA
ncbi:hypothetical protein BKA69DRAFT_1127146 [Paraphysoderma sedebokerense]|nr:hypothetical protein BKA69DRAFT_1127146 [Paraphysoderma sedebokerense]